MRNTIVFLLSLIFVGPACEVATDWDLDRLDTPLLVVEAILTDEEKQQEIFLSQTFDELNDAPPRVTEAVVVLETPTGDVPFFADPIQPGRYISDSVFAIVPFTDYRLRINWEDQEYTATSRLSEVEPIPSVFFVRIGRQDNYRVGNFVPPLSLTEQAMYRVDVDWSHLQPDTVHQARQYFYTFRDIDISQIIPPAKEPVVFPGGSVAVVRKYGLNDDFADFLRAKAIETEWNGSFFFGPSYNLPTNLSEGAVGFFSTCAVLVDTVVVQ